MEENNTRFSTPEGLSAAGKLSQPTLVTSSNTRITNTKLTNVGPKAASLSLTSEKRKLKRSPTETKEEKSNKRKLAKSAKKPIEGFLIDFRSWNR